MRSGSVENIYEGGHGGGVGRPVVADVGEEDWGLGAGEAVALTASSAACGGEGGSGGDDGSGGEDGEEMELGAGGGEERSGVQGVVDGDSCGELGKGRVHAGVGLGGDHVHVGGGGECRGGER
jgi:hypothetical protein